MIKRIAFKVRWWKWFLSGPGPIFVAGMYLRGSLCDSARIARWESREPKP